MPPSSVSTLAARHAPSPMAGFLVHNLHTHRHAAKLSCIPWQDSRLHLTTGHDSLRIIRYRELKLCGFGQEIRIRLGPHGMVKA